MTAAHYRACQLCEAICGVAVEVDDGRIVSVRGDAARALRSRSMYSATSVDQRPHMLGSLLMFGHQRLLPAPDVDRTTSSWCWARTRSRPTATRVGWRRISTGVLATRAKDEPKRLEAGYFRVGGQHS